MRIAKTLARACCALTIAGLVLSAQAAETVITDDGERVRLQDDGTWVILSEDRYATMRDGARVRLRPDGTWVSMAQDPNAAAPATAVAAGDGLAEAASAAPRVLAMAAPSLRLVSVEILRREIRRAKSTHHESRTVYTLAVENETEQAMDLGAASTDAFVASTSRGMAMPIERLETTPDVLGPGERGEVRVVAASAPRWFGTQYMSLELKPGALGIGAGRVLSMNMEDVVRRDVERFD